MQPFIPFEADFFQELVLERRLSSHTAAKYRQGLNAFFTHAGSTAEAPCDLSALSLRVFRDFVIESQRHYHARTVRCWVSGLRTYFTYLLRQGHIARQPMTGLQLPKLDKPLPRYLTRQQMARLLAHPRQQYQAGALSEWEYCRDRLVLELLYASGFRVSEAAALTYGQVDLDQGMATVLGKGEKARTTPLGELATGLIRAYRKRFLPQTGPETAVLADLQGRPLGRAWIQRIAGVVRQNAGDSPEGTLSGASARARSPRDRMRTGRRAAPRARSSGTRRWTSPET